MNAVDEEVKFLSWHATQCPQVAYRARMGNRSHVFRLCDGTVVWDFLQWDTNDSMPWRGGDGIARLVLRGMGAAGCLYDGIGLYRHWGGLTCREVWKAEQELGGRL